MGEMPEFSNWQEAWEWHAQQTEQTYAKQSEATLLKKILNRQYDPYYQIWYSLGKVGTLANCAPVLLDVLRRETGDDNMLIRYHCAAALFHLLGDADGPRPELRQRVQWTHSGEDARQEAINELAQRIQTQLTGVQDG